MNYQDMRVCVIQIHASMDSFFQASMVVSSSCEYESIYASMYLVSCHASMTICFYASLSDFCYACEYDSAYYVTCEFSCVLRLV